MLQPDPCWVPSPAGNGMGTVVQCYCPMRFPASPKEHPRARGMIWDAGQSPSPRCSQGSTLASVETAEEVNIAGPCGSGAPCKAWHEGCTGREGHVPKERNGEPKW